MTTDETHIAERFGQALARRDYAVAHQLLAPELQRTLSTLHLEEEVKRMTS